MTTEPIKAYRLVEMKAGKPHTLFHALPTLNEGRRSRAIPTDTWLEADTKRVSYGRGSPWFEAGFNIMLDREELVRYLDRFTADRELRIVEVRVSGLRPKPNSSANVFLANRMYLPSEQFS